MRRQGPLTMRHLLVAVLVVVVVNAQLTWWIIYALRENRTRLSLEREAALTQAAAYSQEVAGELERAEMQLRMNQLAGARGADPRLPSAFTAIVPSTLGECREGWRLESRTPVLRLALDGTCWDAVADPAWSEALLDPPGELVVTTPGQVPSHALPAPFVELAVGPSPAQWESILQGYRGRIVMMVSEGGFFVVLLLVLIGLLWRTLRRELELERQHQNFLSAITHELKSPLASMRLALETVLRGRAEGTASVRFLENALQDTERLQSLVQKVLEVTRYARGHEAIAPRQANLSAIVEDTVETFRRRATVAGARLEVDLEPDIWADVDGEAISIAVSNLLENAIKYGGTIPTIGVCLRVAEGEATIEVTDNGHGIPEEEVPLVFNRFFRGGDEMTRTTQGTGLGLFLVRQIAEAHRGTVGVADTGPGGTTVRLTLPEAEVAEAGA